MSKIFFALFFVMLIQHLPAQSEMSFQESLIFELQDEHVHGPTIVQLPDQSLLAAWFQGSGERWADDVRIMGARLTPGSEKWSEVFLLADVEGFPDINPVLFLDQQKRLWLMWYPVLANQWDSSLPMYRISENYLGEGAPQWSWQEVLFVKPGDKTERGIQPGDRFVEAVQLQLTTYETYLKEELFPLLNVDQKTTYLKVWDQYKEKMDSLAQGKDMLRKGIVQVNGINEEKELGYPLTRRLGWQTKNKPFIQKNRLIVPLYSDGFDCSLFALSDDGGQSWQFSNPVLGGAGIQPTIASKSDGTLVAYLRDNGPKPNRMQRTTSRDGGLTWSIAKDDILPNPGSGFDMTTLANGDWLMVFNDQDNGRYNLTAAISDDDGKTWKWKKIIENDDRGDQATSSHYPAVIQGSGEYIHLVYSFHRRDRENKKHKTIKYTGFPIEWIKQP